MTTLAIVGTFDTKGQEFQYIQRLAKKRGLETFMIDTGIFDPAFTPDVSRGEVAAAAGYSIEEIAAANDRAHATQALSEGMSDILPKLYAEGKFDGVLSLGGSGGTSIVTAGMRKLPLGVPKLMVSTMASGMVSQYVGTSDIVMMPSIVDVAGLNRISRLVFSNAVAAVAGMLGAPVVGPVEDDEVADERPLIAATMFGVTTPCIVKAKEYIEARGYDVMVFHATGIGGRTMEDLIDAGFFAGVLDITTTEWCDEVVGGVLAAGPRRCTAAGRAGIPQVVSVGALDMVNFGPRDTLPPEFSDRNLYQHNPTVTLMRTNPEELREIATRIAENLNMSQGETLMLIPERGVSMLDAEGGAFWDLEADTALVQTLEEKLDTSKVKIEKVDAHINDDEFAHVAAQRLLDFLADE